MNKHLFNASFALGALALLWVGSGFFGTQWLALAMTLLIAAVYTVGALELRRFRETTQALLAALQAVPAQLVQLEDWLTRVPATLQDPVRLRIEGERAGLPGPTLTPYLVGLLVMLGMLGTFLGMVATLKGAVFALEGTADLAAIRSAFAAPIKGLGLAFGTSVAGVASSAMLGLMSALARRERLQAAQLLDRCVTGSLRPFSHSHQRQQAWLALQAQSQALPAVVTQLQALMEQMQRMGQQTHEHLLANQQGFHSHVQGVYTGLAQAVDQSLHDSLASSAQRAADSLTPVLQAALGGMAQETRQLQAQLVAQTQAQLEALRAQHSQHAQQMASDWQATQTRAQAMQHSAQAAQEAREQQRLQAWTAGLASIGAQTQASASGTLAEITRLLGSAEELVRTRVASEAAWTQQHGARMEHMARLLQSELGALRDAEEQRGQAAVAQLQALQSAVATHLGSLGLALEAPIARLIETASEAPRAAAEVIGQLRKEVSTSVARDNALLEERSRILESLNTLLAGIHHAAAEQRAVIGTLGAEVSASAVEVASLGETFGFAVQGFGAANDKLVASLQRVEGALDKSMARSDDQLAYYVAQAREVIDLSIGSQKDIVMELRQLAGRQAQLAGEA